MNPQRSFTSKNKSTPSRGNPSIRDTSKTKYVKPIESGTFAPTIEPILKLENGYYLLYYHRQKKYTMFLLYLKYIIPIVGLIYLIKKNPFYKSYPIMLPFMVTVFFIVLYKCMRYSSKTNRMIHQILIDPSGTEVTFIYKNRFARKLRNDNLEETLLVQSLADPPQGGEYMPLRDNLFPKKYPFKFEHINDLNYFWIKYYVSQHNYFAIAKKPQYVNYEILCNVMETKPIDFSKAKTYKVHNTKLSQFALEFMLETISPHSTLNYAKRKDRATKIQQIIEEGKNIAKPKVDTLKKNKTYARIMNEPKSKLEDTQN